MNKPIALLVASSVALGAVCMYLWNEAREAREREAAFQAREASLEAKLKQTQADRKVALAAADILLAELQAATANRKAVPREATRTPPAAASAGRDPMPQDMRRLIDERRKRFDDPEYIAAWQAQRKLGLRRQYEDIGAVVGLTPEEVERLLDVLSRQSYLPATVIKVVAGGSQPLPERPPELTREVIEAELLALLGPERYEKFLQYQRTAPARVDMREFRARLPADATIGNEQYERVVSIVAVEKERFRAETSQQMTAAMQSGGDPLLAWQRSQIEQTAQFEQYVRRLGAAVAPYLTPTQMETFQGMYQERVEMQRNQVILMKHQTTTIPDPSGTISTTVVGDTEPGPR